MKRKSQVVKLRSKSGKRVGEYPPIIEVLVNFQDKDSGYFGEYANKIKYFDAKVWEEIK
jgi:hypothetical protein